MDRHEKLGIALTVLFTAAASSASFAGLPETCRKVAPASLSSHAGERAYIAPQSFRPDIFAMASVASDTGDIALAAHVARMHNPELPESAVAMIRETGVEAIRKMDGRAMLDFVDKVQKRIEEESRKTSPKRPSRRPSPAP